MLSLLQASNNESSRELTESQLLLKQMVLNSVTALNTRRNYSKSLDDLFAFAAGRPLTRALLQEWKASMDSLAASTVNVKLATVRRLVAEAKRNGLIGAEEASNLSDIPNVAQRGNRMGNWLTREQAKELLRVPDRSTLKGKRDYAILALLVGCALRRRELAFLGLPRNRCEGSRPVQIWLNQPVTLQRTTFNGSVAALLSSMRASIRQRA
jgi:site-specific recombinase XerD